MSSLRYQKMCSGKEHKVKDESLDDTLMDMAVYAVTILELKEEQKECILHE